MSTLKADEGFYDGDLTVQPVTKYACPVCGSFCDSEDDARKHYENEIAWQRVHKNTTKGTKLKRLDRSGQVEAIFTVTAIKWNYGGFRCGQRLSIFIEEFNDYYQAVWLGRLLPATPVEVLKFVMDNSKEKVQTL